jgi:hypothetical protein
MREEEAMRKWCPFYRVSTGSEEMHAVDNRLQRLRDMPESNCIGSDCMAWRGVKATGYCGLAGKTS